MNALSYRLSRRRLLRGALAGAAGVGAMALLGCGDDEEEAAPTAAQPAASPTSAASPRPTTPPATARWTPIAKGAQNPPALRDHSLTYAADTVYLFGGRAGGSPVDEFWALDTSASPPAWREITAGGGPAPRFGHNALFDGGKLIIVAGQGDDGFLNDVWSFDPAAGSWNELGTKSEEEPAVRYGAGGALDVGRDRVFISHGFTDSGRFDDTWIFDLAENAWSKIDTDGNVPIKRCLLRTVWVNEQMLLFGGQTDGEPFLGDFWSLDTSAGRWTQKQPATLPSARNLFGASFEQHAVAKQWTIYGGNTPDGPSGEIWAYVLPDDAWRRVEQTGTTPSARYSADIAGGGGMLYMYGGTDDSGELDDTWALELASA